MSSIPTDHPTAAPFPSLAIKKQRLLTGDQLLAIAVRGAAVIVLLMLVSLVAVLLKASWPAWTTFGSQFVTSKEWRPNELEQPKRDAAGKLIYNEDNEVETVTLPAQFGALSVIWGTAVSAVIALVIAVPLAIGAALFLIRLAPEKMRGPVSFLIEFLAAVPSIAYGIWGLFVLVPLLQGYIEPGVLKVFGLSGTVAVTGRDMLCGGLILGIMILPIITAVSRDVLAAVPTHQIEGTLALGATWWQSAWQMLGYAKAGLFGAIMLGLARAAGETMAVTMVIGNNNQISANLFKPAQTMASLLANEFGNPESDLHRSALIAVALILLVMSLGFNIVARYLVVGGGSRKAS
ncbi:MAG: phosphate ABC transporter permease subunit PstC [Tepidisphaeraceae bacterium]